MPIIVRMRPSVYASHIFSSSKGAYDISNPTADHTQHAITQDEMGDMVAAVASFRAAVQFSPSDAEVSFQLVSWTTKIIMCGPFAEYA